MIIDKIDIKNYKIIRDSVSEIIKDFSVKFDYENIRVLDIAPQTHKGVTEFFNTSIIETIDIDPNTNCTYTCDLCENNQKIIPDEYYDLIFCNEVLEHTNQPFLAVEELFRLVKKGGTVVTTTPFNFRIHNPLPDNWRFTEHGLKILFSKFNEVYVESIGNDRFLMPIHYRVIAKK